MKISQKIDERGRFSLAFEVESYDATPPVGRLDVDYTPIVRGQDRVALASYLAFGAWISGGVSFPNPVSPELASAIESDAAPVRIRPQQVDYVPRRISSSSACAKVVVGQQDVDSAMSQSIRVLPRGKYAGFLQKDGRMQVASNAYLLAGCLSEWVQYRPVLAVAVLVAEDLGVGALQIDENIVEEERFKLQSLLGAVGLRLTTDNSRIV